MLAVADLEAELEYYVHRLGFAVAWRWGDPPVRAGVVRDGLELQLVTDDRFAPDGASRVYFQVRGVDDYWTRCVERGAEIDCPLGDRPFGMRDFRVADLSGNVLGFGQPVSGSSPAERAAEEVLAVVRRLNAAWPAGRLEELAGLFDPAVVLVHLDPGAGRLTGRDAVVDSYRQFLDQAELHRFEMDAVDADVFGTTAVASCTYTVDYGLEGGRWVESGRELLVLRSGDPGWRIVWRAVVTGEAREAG